MARKGSYFVGLDLGDSKTCVLVCRLVEGAKVEVAGLGAKESKGWRKGAIVNLDSAVLSIKKAVEVAEDAAGVPVDEAYLGIGGPHLRGMNVTGALRLGPRSREVTSEDVHRVFENAQQIELPQGRKLVHAERQEYLLDTQNGIRNPVGMIGSRLEVNVHIVTGSAVAHESIVTAVNRAGIVVLDTVFEPLAVAHACLTTDERELGAALVEIGGGSTGLVIYRDGAARHSAVIPVGGDHFTGDIAIGLRTPIPEAEKMKLAWCAGDPGALDPVDLEVPSVGDRPSRRINYAVLRDIIEPRMTELIELIQTEIARSGLERQLGAGVVLTGGGAKLSGLAARAEEMLSLPARVGRPAGLERMGELLPDPAYAVLVGLIIQARRLRAIRERQERGWTGRILGILGADRNN